MYFAMKVLVDEDAVREYLEEFAGYSSDEISEMEMDDLQSEAREIVSSALSNEISDYLVIDRNTLVAGDIEVYKPTPNNLDYIFS